MLADTAFTWADVEANTNRPDDLACVERKFGDLIPADQPITIISTTAYQVFSPLYSSANIYYQILPDNKGCIVIDVDQLQNITRADLAIVMRLVELTNSGDLTVTGSDFYDISFTYYGKVYKFPELIDHTSQIFQAHEELMKDPKMVQAIGKYSQAWYRDSCKVVVETHRTEKSLAPSLRC